MNKYNISNLQLSNSQPNILTSGIKLGIKATFNFPHKSILTDTQVLNFHKEFANNSSANIKLSKTQLSKMVNLGESRSILDLPKLT